MQLTAPRLSFRVKGEGEPCVQGETSAQSGCVPASGEGGKQGGSERDEIGKGSTGKVYREGDTVIKNGKGTREGEFYAEVVGAEGIAPGKKVGDEIHVPFYQEVLSVDTVPDENIRKSMGDVVGPNKGRLLNAANALSEAGIDYNDPLQVGFDDDYKAHVIDLSNGARVPFIDAQRANIRAVAKFLEDFGAGTAADNILRSFGVYAFAKGLTGGSKDSAIARVNRMAEKGNRAAEHLKSMGADKLAGYDVQHVYYSTNPRHVERDVLQSEPDQDGLKVILSNKPLDDDTIRQYSLTAVVHPVKKSGGTKGDSSVPTPPKIEKSFHSPTCPRCNGGIRSDGKSLWCGSPPCEWSSPSGTFAKSLAGWETKELPPGPPIEDGQTETESEKGLVPEKVRNAVAKAKTWLMDKLRARYGERAAGIIAKIAVLFAPVPIPGSQPLAIALSLLTAEVARMAGALNVTKSADPRDEQAARQLLQEAQAMLERELGTKGIEGETKTFAVGDRVVFAGIAGTAWMPVTPEGYTGVVVKIFKNGKLQVDFARGSQWFRQTRRGGVLIVEESDLQPAKSIKTMSAINSLSGGALVPPPAFMGRKRGKVLSPPRIKSVERSPERKQKIIEAANKLNRAYQMWNQSDVVPGSHPAHRRIDKPFYAAILSGWKPADEDLKYRLTNTMDALAAMDDLLNHSADHGLNAKRVDFLRRVYAMVKEAYQILLGEWNTRGKSISWLTKGEEGGTCEQGQTAANTGCTPASGEGSEKPGDSEGESGETPPSESAEPLLPTLDPKVPPTAAIQQALSEMAEHAYENMLDSDALTEMAEHAEVLHGEASEAWSERVEKFVEDEVARLGEYKEKADPEMFDAAASDLKYAIEHAGEELQGKMDAAHDALQQHFAAWIEDGMFDDDLKAAAEEALEEYGEARNAFRKDVGEAIHEASSYLQNHIAEKEEAELEEDIESRIDYVEEQEDEESAQEAADAHNEELEENGSPFRIRKEEDGWKYYNVHDEEENEEDEDKGTQPVPPKIKSFVPARAAKAYPLWNFEV